MSDNITELKAEIAALKQQLQTLAVAFEGERRAYLTTIKSLAAQPQAQQMVPARPMPVPGPVSPAAVAAAAPKVEAPVVKRKPNLPPRK